MPTRCSLALWSLPMHFALPSASLTASLLLTSTRVWEWVGWCGIRAAIVAKVLSFAGSHRPPFLWLVPCSNGPHHLPLRERLFPSTALDLPETRGHL